MAPPTAPPAEPAHRLPPFLVGAAYLLVYLALDWASYIRPYQGFNITPWNPQPALAIALLLWRPRWMGLVWLGLLAAEFGVRGGPERVMVVLATSAALTLSYAAIARVLSLRLDPALPLATRRDLAWFTLATLGGALLSGTLYVGTYAGGGQGPAGPFTGAVARYWVGEAVGLVVMLPLLLLLKAPRRRADLRHALLQRETWLVAALAMAMLLFVFSREHREQFKYFYLLFLPVVWVAGRSGLAGAVLLGASAQLGLIAVVQAGRSPDLTVFEVQVLMAALTMTGLVLGVAVDERERAEAKLRDSLRLAAAGQMAAALAHELSQPLTALHGYAQAARRLAASPSLPPGERLDRLAEVAARMADDALRASEVVRRLRDFFRSGSTQLQRIRLGPLVADALAAARPRAVAQGIGLEGGEPPDVELLVDPVQIGVVLRNLLANALDAAAGSPAPGLVQIQARLQAGALHLEVRDSGPGIDAARLGELFEAATSDKPGGMGIGLSICRAIVQAHGGRLWAEPGPPGVLCLTLPVEPPESAAPHDAP